MSISVVQVGASCGNDDLAIYLKQNYSSLDFALFVEANERFISQGYRKQFRSLPI